MGVIGHSQDPAANQEPATEEFLDGLHQPVWSVISFEKREAAGLVYGEAFSKLEELEARGVAGLCVVTDNAAAKIASEKN